MHIANIDNDLHFFRLWDVDSLETIGILGFGEYEVGVAAVAFSTNTLRDELLVISHSISFITYHECVMYKIILSISYFVVRHVTSMYSNKVCIMTKRAM